MSEPRVHASKCGEEANVYHMMTHLQQPAPPSSSGGICSLFAGGRGAKGCMTCGGAGEPSCWRP